MSGGPRSPASAGPGADGRVDPVRLHLALERIWGTGPGWARLSAVSHSVIGKRFMATAAAFFLVGGLLAMLIRAQLATSHGAFLGPGLYAQVFTMHGTIMMFLFAIPMIEGLAIYLLPKMLGARDMAFPRLSAYGYWCYLFGGTILILAMLAGLAPDGGWFMYPPLTSKAFSPGINADVWLIGVTFVEISGMCAAVEIAVSVLKLRAPGMSLDRMPLFAWAMLVTAGMMLLAFPPLILGSILLELERAFDWPFFDPKRGGDPLLWQHLFWLFGHPEVYIIFLPAAGVVSTLIPVYAGRPLVGYTWVVVAMIALGILSFGLWVHHMFVTGIPHLGLGFFSAASMLVVLPTGVQIFAWLATLAGGRPRLDLPMLYVLGFFAIFVIGGLTGVMVAVVPFDTQVHDTHFVVAHLHYVLVGGFVFPVIAAAYHWLPHVLGRRSAYDLGKPAFWLVSCGFNLTFFHMHLTGLLGMPRRVHAYAPGMGWEGLNLLSSIGAFFMAIGFAVVAIDILLMIRQGPRTPRNPWKAHTLEWAMPVPATSYGFASLPQVDSREPLRDAPGLGPRLAAGEGYLGFARKGQLETLSVGMVDGRPEQVIVLPGSTFLPLWTAMATGGVVLALLAKLYWPALAGFIVTVGFVVAWSAGRGSRRDTGPVDAGRGLALPTQDEGPNPPSWWGLAFAIVSDAGLFASLLFGVLYLWVSSSGWPPPALLDGGHAAGIAAALGFTLAGLAGSGALRANARAMPGLRDLALVAAIGGHFLAGAALATIAFVHLPAPTTHAYAATMAVLCAHLGLHAALGAVFAGHGLRRSRAGRVSPARSLDLRIGRLWHVSVAVAGWVGLVVLFALPLQVGR